jgi:hypothetical protein
MYTDHTVVSAITELPSAVKLQSLFKYRSDLTGVNSHTERTATHLLAISTRVYNFPQQPSVPSMCAGHEGRYVFSVVTRI